MTPGLRESPPMPAKTARWLRNVFGVRVEVKALTPLLLPSGSGPYASKRRNLAVRDQQNRCGIWMVPYKKRRNPPNDSSSPAAGGNDAGAGKGRP